MKNLNFTLIIALLIGITPVAVATDNDVYATGGPEHKAHYSGMTREVVDGLAHYQFNVRVGPGDFDIVRLHRVVREVVAFFVPFSGNVAKPGAVPWALWIAVALSGRSA